ncbi:MAG: RNA polymerase subunit sigma-24 [Pseudonocardiales bacterium]|nr:MAG: RNA polymerase subunit sigma-24 [Pseudonocardiales bacterium]
MVTGGNPRKDDPFEQHRSLMFGISYRMLGTVADAEDTIQETWLRWNKIDQSLVADARGYLVRAVTRTSIDQLRRAKARREQYIGSWLPEPLLTGPDVADRVVQDKLVSMAILVMLESTSPLERAVFVLREVFGFSYPEVAQAVGRSDAAVRQLGHRAKTHLRQPRSRFQAGPRESRRVTERFLEACLGGDLSELLKVLAPGVTLWVDAHGTSEGARQPIHGAAAIGEYLASIAPRYPDGIHFRYAEFNGEPGGLLAVGRDVYAVVALELEPAGSVAAIRVVRTPEKLSRLNVPPTSSSGTPSPPPTCRAPRTGRSCP